MFKRQLQFKLPKRQSAFLWGARQTGKSSYLKQQFPQAVYYDLLKNHELVRFNTHPDLLREEVLALNKTQLQQPIIIDEIQKVPDLLNEVHWLIENSQAYFILCGSSARKLKTRSTNLLGGRAWPMHFYPLVFPEMPNFDLLRALQHGLLPKHYLAEPTYINDYLQAYIDVYLTDEIRNEGLVRNLQSFARFLEIAGLSNGDMINFNNIARDCGVDRKTVQSYYQILIDTLLGYFIYPYKSKLKRDAIVATPKFYLFDVAVANYLAQQPIKQLKGDLAGHSFEHYILMELMAYRGLNRLRFDICYWRTKSGLEVDFILGKAQVALEIKISQKVHQQDLRGLIAFCRDHPNTTAMVVSQDPRARQLHVDDNITIQIIPWAQFLKRLWQGDIL